MRFAQPAGAQRFQQIQQHLLDEVVRGRGGSQMAKTVEPNARRHAPSDLGLGFQVAFADAQRQISVAQLDGHSPSFYRDSVASHSTSSGPVRAFR